MMCLVSTQTKVKIICTFWNLSTCIYFIFVFALIYDSQWLMFYIKYCDKHYKNVTDNYEDNYCGNAKKKR